MALALILSGCTGLFRLGGEGSVSGVVTVDGLPPGPVNVEVVARGTRFRTGADGATGVFKLDGLPPGRYQIATQGRGVAETVVPVTLRRGAHISGIELHTYYLPPLPVTFTFDDPADARLLEPFHGAPFQLMQDPDGNWAYYLDGGEITIPEGAAGAYRYALLKYPNLDTFALEVDVRGGLTSSQAKNVALIFGWVDPENYYYVFLSDTSATRVARVRDGSAGSAQYLNQPGVTNLWLSDRDRYQTIRLEVTRFGATVNVKVYVNGVHLDVLDTEIPANEYKAGRIGIGTYNSHVQSAFFDNVYIVEL
ncbi:MAG: hypothetical protein CW345_07280 [Firmicutes bacterium]|nr:hypothetical protein [Bacillota bacterium]